MNNRLKKLLQECSSKKIDAYLVSSDTNISYLTQFATSESWLFVSAKANVYITDFRYILEARKGLRGISVRRYTRSPYDEVAQLVKKYKVKRLGFNDRQITVANFKKFKSTMPTSVKLVACNQFVEEIRMVKERDEIRGIRQALKINLAAYKYIQPKLKPGKSEQEILFELEKFVRAKGVKFSFSPIVASGPNSSYPHAQVTDRRFRKSEVVLIDMGIDIGGYKSDLTRMFFLGKIPHLVQEINEKVACAQKKAIESIQPRAVARIVDEQARNYLRKNKLAKYFGHSLGHGVGLDIHEAPTISPKSGTLLRENMIFTVEPAVYLPNKFGIRIEDMVLVTPKGCEVLSR